MINGAMLVPLGAFHCRTGSLIVADPCYAHYSIEKLGVIAVLLERAAIGRWKVWHEWIDDPEAPEPRQPRGLIARSIDAADLNALKWREVQRSLCIDIGQAGIFDANFFCNGLVAVERQVREVYLYPERAWIGDGGVNSLCCYDPSRVAVFVAEDTSGLIVGVRTTWYSGCIRPRMWTYSVDGAEVDLHLDDDGLWCFIGDDYLLRDYLTLEYAGSEDQEDIRAALRIPPEIFAEISRLLRTRGYFDR